MPSATSAPILSDGSQHVIVERRRALSPPRTTRGDPGPHHGLSRRLSPSGTEVREAPARCRRPRRASPSATRAVRHPAGTTGVLGPTAHHAQPAQRHRTGPQGVDEPSPTLTVRPLEAALTRAQRSGVGHVAGGVCPHATGLEWARTTRRRSRRARHGADLHERLVPVPGPALGDQAVGQALGGTGRQWGSGHGSGQHPGHVDVHHGLVALEGEARTALAV